MIKRIFRLPDAMNTTGLSSSSIYRHISTNEFPNPLKLCRCNGLSNVALNGPFASSIIDIDLIDSILRSSRASHAD